MGLTYCIGSGFVNSLCNDSHKETLSSALYDMQNSCKVAITTLNDILSFDKLEGGDMKVDRVALPVSHLIHTSVKAFDIQVILSVFTPNISINH